MSQLFSPGEAPETAPVSLTPQERHLQLFVWNDTAREYPRDRGLHQLFEAQARRTPTAIAVSDEQDQLTYHDLNVQANHLARYLRSLGVGPEVLVGISLERSVQMLVALLAILKAGGAYVPLDPGFPAERLAYMIENARLKVLLTQNSLRSQLPLSEQLQVICIDSDRPQFEQQSGTNLDLAVNPEQLAYVLYTSGSTGKPKGVQIPQRALVNFLCSMQSEPGLCATDTLMAVTTLSFDIAGLELYLPLLVGARVFIASRETATNGLALGRIMEREGATMLQATPVTWRLLLNSGWRGKPDLVALCGGEALLRDLAAQLLPRVRALYNMYGPTETTVWSTLCRVQSADGVISIGRPIANTQVYALDDDLHPVPISVPGELYIGGDGVARGYLHRPELTEERFLPDPFCSAPAGFPRRIYRTGDLARYLADGSLEHLGRLDHQVKIRGFRIELGEIEAALHEHPGVRDGVVMAREDIPGEKRLVAYIVPTGDATQDHQQMKAPGSLMTDLRDFLRQKLPEYMVPAAFVPMEALPLTPNDKIDRKALPAPDHAASGMDAAGSAGSRPPLATPYTPPGDEVEQTIAVIWQEYLGVAPIGSQDRFDELGGDSLQAFLIMSRLYEHFQLRLTARDFPATVTVARLAQTVRQKLEELLDPQALEALLAEIEEE